MEGEITTLRSLLSKPIIRLDNADRILESAEKNLPPGRRGPRTRQYVAINKAIIRQECEQAKIEIDLFCAALDGDV